MYTTCIEFLSIMEKWKWWIKSFQTTLCWLPWFHLTSITINTLFYPYIHSSTFDKNQLKKDILNILTLKFMCLENAKMASP